ncbi:unnamed protein product, partial [Natator depressus]
VKQLTTLEKGYHTSVKEFILLGFPGTQYLQISLFVLFLVTGNVAIIVLVATSRHLRTPMYFLLCNFSFPEVW